MSIYLEVPYEQKDSVKARGARWDSIKKKWYVPTNRLLSDFEDWLPKFDEKRKKKSKR
jgi:exodeoxyribonuclease VII large subunit